MWSRQPAPSPVGLLFHAYGAPGSSYPPPIAFCPASHITAVSLWLSGAIDPRGLDGQSPAAELAGPGCRAAAADHRIFWPRSYGVVGDERRFASGTTPAAIAVPLSETNRAATESTSAGPRHRLSGMSPPPCR